MKQKSFFLRYYRLFVLSAIPIFWLILLLVIDQPLSYWLEFWWMIPIAFFIALTVNTVGISGAALFVPFFTLIFPLIAEPLSPLQSVKLGLITESFGLSSSAIAFIAFGLVDRKLALYSVLGALPFVVTSALLSNFLPETVMLFLVAAALIVSVFMMRHEKTLRRLRIDQHQQPHVDLTVSHGDQRSIRAADHHIYRYSLTPAGYRKRFIGFGLGGLFQGAAGFGIGEMGIISMLLTKIPIRIAIGTSHLVVASTAVVATFIHVLNSNALNAIIPWNIPFMTVPAVIVGGQLAPFVAARLPTKKLERFIAILFLGIALALMVLIFR